MKPELDFLNEYLDVMKCLATALDLMQGEQNSFLVMLLPTVITIKTRLQTMKPKLVYSKSLVEAIQAGLEKRFGSCYDDRELIIATVTIPQFKLFWIDSEEEIDRAKCLLRSEIKRVNNTGSSVAQPHEEKNNDNSFFLFKQNTNVLLPASTELDQYLSDSGTNLCIVQKYPSLKKIFLRYNTAITSSAPVERLFSSGKIILSSLRNKLKK
uniref:HAT C-terminal dimerisation domain-containing protein n=1 Tax=Strigamia maritima TaxID=126957 RepID=T1IH67_STRMM